MKENYHAISLGKFDIGETDRLYTFYTREKGLLRVKARGVRKSSARLASHVEDFVVSHITIAKNRGPGTLTGAITEVPCVVARNNYGILMEMMRLRDIFLRLMRTDIIDVVIFEKLIQTFAMLETGNSHSAGFVVDAFLLQLYDALGYRFPLVHCAICENVIVEGDHMFTAYHGGVVCQVCGREENYSMVIDSNTLKIFRIIMTNSLLHIPKVIVDKSTTKQLRIITDHIAIWIMR